MKERLLTDELFRYLMRLHGLLQQRGASSLADAVLFASRFAEGSTTELYAEAEMVLRKVLYDHQQVLREQEVNELGGVLDRIRVEFRMIGGA